MNKKLFVVALALLLVLSGNLYAYAATPAVVRASVAKVSFINVRAFEDVNENMRWDNGEPAVVGLPVTYISPSGKTNTCQTPKNLVVKKSGTYKFRTSGNENWSSIGCIADGKTFTAGTAATVTVKCRRDRHKVTFALKRKGVIPPPKLSNLYTVDVFYDQNANGVQESWEPMQEGVRYRATNLDTGEVFDSTTSPSGAVGLVFPSGNYKIEMLMPTSVHWFNTTGNAVSTGYFPGGVSYYNIAGVAFEATVGFASTSWWSVNPQQIKPEAIEYLNQYSQLPGAPYESAQEISDYLGQSEGSLPASMITNVLNAYLYDGNLMKSAMLVEGKWVALQPLFDGAYNAYTTEHDKIDSYVATYHSLQYSNQITTPPGTYPFSY